MANVPPLELTPAQVIVNLGVTGSDLTEAEALGILVAGTVQRSTEAKDQARRFAEDLLIDLAETERPPPELPEVVLGGKQRRTGRGPSLPRPGPPPQAHYPGGHRSPGERPGDKRMTRAPRTHYQPAPDPLADLRDPVEGQGPGDPEPLVAPPPVFSRDLLTPEDQEAARAILVAAWHADSTTLGFLHKGGVCGCWYLSGVTARAILPVQVSAAT